MKTSSKKLQLTNILQGVSSRGKAIEAREHILELLNQVDRIEIDLNGVNFTPSVADEVIGVLADMLGAHKFKQKIKILNATDSQMALMRHVIARRTMPQSKAS